MMFDVSSADLTLSPGHWTCSFVCHFNATESIQSCSHFGALNLSYILPSLSYQVFIYTSTEACEGKVLISRGEETCYLSENLEPTQQTRDIDPMLDQCWSTVYDAGPTLIQHRVDVSCLLGSGVRKTARQAATSAKLHAPTNVDDRQRHQLRCSNQC